MKSLQVAPTDTNSLPQDGKTLMILALACFSLLVGLVCPLLGSVAFVIYFSVAAASAIALLAFLSGSGAGMVLLAWLATVVAIQVGCVLSIMILAMLKSNRAGASFFAMQHEQPSPVDEDLGRPGVPTGADRAA